MNAVLQAEKDTAKRAFNAYIAIQPAVWIALDLPYYKYYSRFFFLLLHGSLAISTQFSLKVYAISARAGIPDDPNEVQLSQWLTKQLENLQAFSQPRKAIVFAESKLSISNVCISLNTSTWAEILEEQLERCSTPWRGNISLDGQKVRRAMYAKEKTNQT